MSAAYNFFRSPYNTHGIAVLPTGAGKSLVIADLVDRLNEPVLIFQPSKEILEQNRDKLVAYGYSPTVYSASSGQKKVSNLTLSTIGSAINNREAFVRFKHIIIDECHHGMNPKLGSYANFIKWMDAAKVLGLTATPYRMSTTSFGTMMKFLTRTHPRIFSEVVHVTQSRNLYDNGFWSPLQYYSVPGFNSDELKKNSNGSEYSDESVVKYYGYIGFHEHLVDVVRRLIAVNRRGVLVFTRFVEESKYVSDCIPGVAIVTGKMKMEERDRIIRDFKSGKVKVVCNVGVLTTGFDYPELDTVVIARPTMSLALYYQMCGRAVRPHPDKKESWIVDVCDNIKRFGRVENMEIVLEGVSKWYVRNGNKRLTNEVL